MTEQPHGRTGLSPRAEAIRDQLAHADAAAESESDTDWVNAAAMLLVDAIKDEDIEPLDVFLDGASRLAARRHPDRALDSLAAIAHWGIVRAVPTAIGRSIVPESAEGRILVHVAGNPDCSNTDLAQVLDLVPETVTRVGKRLERDGLVRRHKAGKWLKWRLTPAGQRALAAAYTAAAGGCIPDDLQHRFDSFRRFRDEPAARD